VVEAVLQIIDLSKSFGGIHATRNVSLDVHEHETHAVIGPNGAGKTTLFELIGGFVQPNEGTVTFDGIDISGRSPEARSAMGLVRSFQNATMFPTMTTRDIMVMAEHRGGAGNDSDGRADEALRLFGLAELADQPVSALSTGTRRIVELAANVALRPRLLLLDEPSAGIAQAETEVLGTVIEQIRDAYGITFVVIEHDMPMLASICDRMIALEVGSVIAEGTPAEVQADDAVVRSYLGSDAVAIARSGSS